MHLSLKTLFVILTISFLASCSGKKDHETSENIEIENETTHSQFLKIDHRDEYTFVKVINPWDTTKVLSSYILVPEDKAIPSDIPEGVVLKTPVKSLLVYTSVTGNALAEIGAENVIKGVADSRFFKLPYVVNGLKDGSVMDVGLTSSPSREKIIALNPDGILLNIYEGMDFKGIDNLKMPLLKMVDSMEPTPLGRAEWIKFLGALTCRENESDSIFNSVCTAYEGLRDKTSSLGKRPKVMTETIYEGVWYVPGGNSYQAKLIEDASGNYFRSDDDSNGSLSLSFEQVLDKGKDSDIWLIKVFGKELTKSGLLQMDKRYGYFSPVEKEGVFYSNTAVSTLFEDFPFHPEKLLHDYAVIFHPEAFKGDSLVYFKKMN